MVNITPTVLYRKKSNYGKVSKKITKKIKNPGKSPRNGRAPRAKRAAHAHFGDFPGFLIFFGDLFSIQYCIVIPPAKFDRVRA